MNAKFMMGLVVLATVGLAACDESSKLAGDVAGTWDAHKTEIVCDRQHKDKDHKDRRNSPDARPEMKSEMACAPTITFVRKEGTNGGTMTINTNYEVTQDVSVSDATVAAPVKATVCGTVTASGTWMAKDDDEIDVTLDASKTNVTVDPASLVLNYGTLTDAPTAKLDSLKQNVAANIETPVVAMIKTRMSRLHEFDDVKVVGNTMKMELGKTKMTFTKK